MPAPGSGPAGKLHRSHFTLKRWRESLASGKRAGRLAQFHTRHELLLQAHRPRHARLMGSLAAGVTEENLAGLYEDYQGLLLATLRLQATVKKNADVLHHLLGYFKKVLGPDEMQELLEIINHYRRELVPLIVPLTLINHYVRRYGPSYLQAQYYLSPHPLELKLRNHA